MPYPAAFVPDGSPNLPGGDDKYLRAQLAAIQTTLDQVLNMLPQVATAAPVRPQAGMIRKAVSPWRPVVGQTTDRWVVYSGTAWEYFA